MSLLLSEYEQALVLYQKAGKTFGLSEIYWGLGIAALERGQHQEAKAFSAQALADAREGKVKRLIIRALSLMGSIAMLEKAYEEAATLFEEALALSQEIEDEWRIAVELGNLGKVALYKEDLPHPDAFLKHGLTIRRKFVSDIRGLYWYLLDLAAIAGKEGRPKRATQLFGAVTALLEASNGQIFPSHQMEYNHYLTVARAQLDEATFNQAWATGQAMSLDEAVAYALAESSDLTGVRELLPNGGDQT